MGKLYMGKFCLLLLIGLLLIGCGTETAVSQATHLTPSPSPTLQQGHIPSATPAAAKGVLRPSSATGEATAAPPPTLTPVPTAAHTLTPTPSPTATATATPNPSPTAVACANRLPSSDDLFTIVTLDYGLSREYAPPDLVDLSDYLPHHVTLGYPTQLRRVAVEPLVEMIAAMETAGLHPQIISGYRSYAAQAIAWNKWHESHPETAAIVSAPPGHSEHQLGATVDFGSPELPSIVGEDDIQFHTYFYKTSEGQWLLEHAHEYGFTLSYSREAFELTGLYYEPWHYRYVGRELAKYLYENNMTLTAYLLEQNPQPCTP